MDWSIPESGFADVVLGFALTAERNATLTPLACRASLDLWTWGKEEKERQRWELVPAMLCDGPHLHVYSAQEYQIVPTRTSTRTLYMTCVLHWMMIDGKQEYVPNDLLIL